MEKIKLNEAIKNEKVYRIDNKDDTSFTQNNYFLINGIIRFISQKKESYK